eukprot:scaffold101767_cov60-Phaeocystis_antarctica.AAC.10
MIKKEKAQVFRKRLKRERPPLCPLTLIRIIARRCVSRRICRSAFNNSVSRCLGGLRSDALSRNEHVTRFGKASSSK